MNTAPPVNYRLPLLATIVSTLVVMVLFILLAFFTAAWSLRQFTTVDDETGSPIIGGLCGVATIALIAGTLYFALALIKGVRDLTTPLQRLPGYIERKYTGMGRTGGFWIVVRAGDRPALATAPVTRLATALTTAPSSSPTAPSTAPSVPALAPPSSAAPTSFGGGLAEVARQVSTTPRPPADVPGATPVLPIATDWTRSRIFRVDKSVYNALRDGESVVVAYSRFLEHVYYVEHTEDGEQVPLRNTSLL